MKTAIALAVLLGACVRAELVDCSDGRTCPAHTVCDDVRGSCLDPVQLLACEGAAELASCSTPAISDGRCFGGVCLPAGCGNGELEPEELCDDGNTLDDDGCSANCESREICGDGVRDSSRGESCDDGNTRSRDGCSSTCGDEELVIRTPVPDPPPPTFGWFGAYDSTRKQLVLFGDSTWTWDGMSWTLHAPRSAPGPRSGHAMAFDPRRHRVVLFGGTTSSGDLNDTWEWDGTTWHLMRPPRSPSTRGGAAMAWDPTLGRVVLFGGTRYLSSHDDTWTWDGEAWTELAPAVHPPARLGAALAADPSRSRLILVGGSSGGLTPTNRSDTWAFDGTTWSPLAAATLPAAIRWAGLVWDPVRRVMVLAAWTGTHETYELVQDRWLPQLSSPAPTTFGGILAYDLVGSRIVQYGGQTALGAASSELVERRTGSWVGVPRPPWPAARRNAMMATDPLRGRTLLFGGRAGPTIFGDSWEWNGRGWVQPTIVGPTPTARSGAGIAYDRRSATIVMFGGFTNVRLDDMWQWNGTSWTEFTGPRPPPRANPTMAYDAARERLVLFGGDGPGGPLGDTWEWDGTSWTEQHPIAAPTPARTAASMAYDRRRQRVVLLGGLVSGGGLSDVWEYDGTTWRSIDTPGTLPEGRATSALLYDEARQRSILFGGTIASFAIWEWDGTTWSQPILPAQCTIANAPAGSYDPVRGESLVFGGGAANAAFDSLVVAAYAGDAVEVCDAHADIDGDGAIGCADEDCRGVCTPDCFVATCTGPKCGDGGCNVLESDRSCPGDCPAAPAACGDDYCSPGEICPGDC